MTKAREERSLTVDAAVKVLGALLMATTVPVLAWTVHQTVDLKERIAKVEVRERGNHEILTEIRTEIRELRALLLERGK